MFNILLSLKDESKATYGNSYINVTYDAFFEKIKKNIGYYIPDANNSWIIYLKDFMETISNLKDEGRNINMEFLNFLQNNSDEVEELIKECSEFKRDELSPRTKKLRSLIALGEYEKNMEFTSKCYNGNANKELYSSFVINIVKSNGQILVIETYIDVSGWHIAYFYRKGGNKELLESKLDNLGIDYSYCDFNGNFIVIDNYDFNETYDVIIKGIHRGMDYAKNI